MIVWIASYPKSGNTWLRLLISNYLWPKNSNIFDTLKFIPGFPQKKFFQEIIHEDELKKDDMKIFKHFISAQEKINLNEDLNFLKTHNFAGSISGYPFTNKENSCAAIYVVRDPRSVAVSHAYHHKYEFSKSTDRILSTQNIANNDGYLEARLSWNVHYTSWKKINIPKIILKYEDLVDDTYNNFLKILEFINQFKKIDINKDKVHEVINRCSFEQVSTNEKRFGFIEKKGKENFFRKGLVDEWKTALNKDLIQKIEKEFSNEMKELKYL